MSFLKKVFVKAPFFVKRIFINAEAVRRDYFRRYGDYNELLKNADINYIMTSGYNVEKEELFRKLIENASLHVPKYRNCTALSLSEIGKLPLLHKSDIREHYDEYLSDKIDKKTCFKGITSGSTGTAVSYYRDRESVRLSQLYAEKLLEFAGLRQGDRRARISGVSLIPFECEKPPFWVYIDRYKQLQMSAYHIKSGNAGKYINAMRRYNVTFGTGYATAWLFLAEYVLKENLTVPKLSAIVTDSEGITQSQQEKVEKAFNCPVYQTYGLSETGQLAFQCRHGSYHIVPSVCHIEILDSDGKPAPKGTLGEIAVTSLIANDTPVIRYLTGDLGVMGKEPCACGWNTDYLEHIEGRVDDYILTPDGRRIGRLSHIAKTMKGVLQSQIVQTAPDSVVIRVVQDRDFDESSMEETVKNAAAYLGNMKVRWENTNELERTKNGKVRFVIRKI
ncbi:MAG: AMP-binding protein [Bacillota bacterium]|nr:AMP-binding protein [Bacillota bacterium]